MGNQGDPDSSKQARMGCGVGSASAIPTAVSLLLAVVPGIIMAQGASRVALDDSLCYEKWDTSLMGAAALFAAVLNGAASLVGGLCTRVRASSAAGCAIAVIAAIASLASFIPSCFLLNAAVNTIDWDDDYGYLSGEWCFDYDQMAMMGASLISSAVLALVVSIISCTTCCASTPRHRLPPGSYYVNGTSTSLISAPGAAPVHAPVVTPSMGAPHLYPAQSAAPSAAVTVTVEKGVDAGK